MTTYWHLAPATYHVGEDLQCWNYLAEAGVVTTDDWKWTEAEVGADGHMVCLFPSDAAGLAERDAMIADYPDMTVLRIELAEDDEEITMTRADEGYPAVWGRIPARCITVQAGTPKETTMDPS
jgi:hypothetical protein